MTFGQQIKEARERKGLTQEQLAKEIGVSQQSVAQWELDKASPRGVRLAQIQRILEIQRDNAQVTMRELYDKAAERIALRASPPITAGGSIARAPGTFEDARQFAQETMLRFAQALPEEFRGGVQQRVEFGPLRYDLDYFSPAVVVEIKAFGPRAMLSRHSTERRPVWVPSQGEIKMMLWNLATLRQLTESTNPDRDFLVFFIVGEGGDVAAPAMSRHRLEASLHGIDIQIVETPEKAADKVAQYEKRSKEIDTVIGEIIGPAEEEQDELAAWNLPYTLGNIPKP